MMSAAGMNSLVLSMRKYYLLLRRWGTRGRNVLLHGGIASSLKRTGPFALSGDEDMVMKVVKGLWWLLGQRFIAASVLETKPAD